MVGAHRTDVGMALAFSPWWRRTARPCSAHRTPRSARLYLKTVSSDHARAIGIRTDEVPAADALTCVLVLTAEPVPLVSSDRADDAYGIHAMKCPPSRGHGSGPSHGEDPPSQGRARQRAGRLHGEPSVLIPIMPTAPTDTARGRQCKHCMRDTVTASRISCSR